MEEKILIKSEQYNVKKFLISMLIIGAILSAIGFIGVVSICVETSSGAYQK